MDQLSEHIKNTVSKTTSVDKALEDIFLECFGVRTTAEDGDSPNPGYNAYALLATSVALSVSNVFLALKDPSSGRTYRAICDLTYELNINKFWQDNANILLPVMHSALNAYRDGADMLVARQQRDEYSSHDQIISASRGAALEIFPMIAYCLGASKLMVTASLSLKSRLAPYFL